MIIQDIINKVVNWLHQHEITEFDKEYAELNRGKQFLGEEEILRCLDFVLESFDGEKISLGSLLDNDLTTGVVGKDSSID